MKDKATQKKMNTFLAEQCTVWKCKQIGQQTLRFALRYDSVFIQLQIKTVNRHKHSQRTTDITTSNNCKEKKCHSQLLCNGLPLSV